MPSALLSVPRAARATSLRVLALALIGMGGCGPARGERVVAAESGAVDVSVRRPAFTLTDTDGKPFAFAERTAGRLTFLEFGYTNCPDVCPVHMANLATVIGKLAPSDRMRTTVVFVSVDPERDSAQVIRKWLDNFDVNFIGLRGTRAEVDAAQQLVGFGAAIIQADTAGRGTAGRGTAKGTANGATTVSHAAPVVVFSADDTAHVMYPFGTRQSDWARDIPLLLARGGKSGAEATASMASAQSAAQSATRPTATIERAYVVVPAGQGPAALYFTARNPFAMADTIVSIGTEAIGPASLHQSMHDKAAGTIHMMAVAALEVPPHGAVRLTPGGFHGMIGPLNRPLVRGERIALTVRFEHAGVARADATVITYADVDSATTPVSVITGAKRQD